MTSHFIEPVHFQCQIITTAVKIERTTSFKFWRLRVSGDSTCTATSPSPNNQQLFQGWSRIFSLRSWHLSALVILVPFPLSGSFLCPPSFPILRKKSNQTQNKNIKINE
jgi:hypothetical protein